MRPKQYATKTAGAQEAHECIRPAGAHFRDPAEIATKVPADQLKLYTLIWQRTLACQMADATGSTATVRLSSPTESDGEAMFQASGTVIEFPGFMKATGEGRRSVADAKKSAEAAGVKIAIRPKSLRRLRRKPMTTFPCRRCSRATSLPPWTLPRTATRPSRRRATPKRRSSKTLEQKEIGRPSTYASIISTIIDRGYVYERGRALIPSWLAFSVTKLLETKFPKYVDYEFTADMETGLDQIAGGHETRQAWLTCFYFVPAMVRPSPPTRRMRACSSRWRSLARLMRVRSTPSISAMACTCASAVMARILRT